MNTLYNSVPEALVLAAGRGSRLMPFTKNKPKCLVVVGKYPILYYQLKALQMHGIKKVGFVIGYRGEQIRKYIQNKFPELRTYFIKNDRYKNTNEIYSLYLARNKLTKDIVLLDSDALFSPKVLHKLLFTKQTAVALRRGKVGEEEMKISLHNDGTVKRLSKSLDPRLSAGEFMAVSFFRKDFLAHLVPALENKIKQGGITLDRETAIETILHKKPLLAVDITEHPSIEIDFPDDLRKAEKIILPQIISLYHDAIR